MQKILMLWICCCMANATERTDTKLLFEQFSNGKLIERKKAFLSEGAPVYIDSGPDVGIANGQRVSYSHLVYQARIVAGNGIDAFDEAFKHLDDPRAYMRCISAEALIRITRLDPGWWSFGVPGKTFNGDAEWSSRAKAAWLKWKAESGPRE